MSARSFRRERRREAEREQRRAKHRARRTVATGALLGVTALIAPAAANATTFTVDNTGDTTTAGACDPTIADDCSLRQAVGDANTNAGPDIVSLSSISGTITLTEGQINVTDSVSIQGPGAGYLTISGDANGDGIHDLAYYGTGNGGATPQSGDSRIFQFGSSTAGVTASVSGLTISGGTSGVSSKYVPASGGSPAENKYYGQPGGGILAQNSIVTISGVTMTDNQATEDGGAIYASPVYPGTSSGLTITSSTLNANHAYGAGAGVGAHGGELTVTDSQITGNTAEGNGTAVGGTSFKYNPHGDGGGIDGSSITALTVTDSNVANNTATDYNGSSPKQGDGGGLNIYGGGAAEFQLSGTTISGNTAIGNGGGANLDAGQVTVDRSTIADNSVADGGAGSNSSGGGMKLSGDVHITASTLSGNHADAATSNLGSGGALYWGSGTGDDGLTVQNSTISGNEASGDGGGVRLNTYSNYDSGTSTTSHSGPVSLGNSTIASNTAATGGGVFEDTFYNSGAPRAPASKLTSTIVGANSPDDLAVASTDYSGGFDAANSLVQSDVSGIPFTESPAGSNVLGVPPQLGTLRSNGGVTKTRLPDASSPALDAGLANGLGTDQRGPGFPRTIDQPGVPNHSNSDGTDIGAVELPASFSPSGGGLAPTSPAPHGKKKKKCKRHKKKHKRSAESAKKKKCKKKKKKRR